MRKLEMPSGRQAYDKSEYDAWCERIRINDQFEVSTELIGRLIVKVEGNPYPGEQKRVLKLAADLIPERGREGWCAIFRDPEFNFPPNFEHERISFPAEVEVDVKAIEKKLWELVREDGTIAAAAVPEALGMGANSKIYREMKKRLEEKGWVWRAIKRNGSVSKVVVPPPR